VSGAPRRHRTILYAVPAVVQDRIDIQPWMDRRTG
jgi:hypothetical protein